MTRLIEHPPGRIYAMSNCHKRRWWGERRTPPPVEPAAPSPIEPAPAPAPTPAPRPVVNPTQTPAVMPPIKPTPTPRPRRSSRPTPTGHPTPVELIEMIEGDPVDTWVAS